MFQLRRSSSGVANERAYREANPPMPDDVLMREWDSMYDSWEAVSPSVVLR